MRDIKKSLKTSILLIIISLIISIGIKFSLKIDNPVFLKSYLDMNYYENEDMYSFSGHNLELKYITNKGDKRQVTSVIFDNAPYLDLIVSENNISGFMTFYDGVNSNIESYGPYDIHTVFIDLDMSRRNKKLEEVIELDKAKVYFNNGESMDVDLGKIILSKYKENQSPLDSIGMNGSSDGSSQSIFYVTDNIFVSKVYSQLFEYSRDLLEFNIDKLGYLEEQDVVYNKYEHLYFTSQFHNIEDPSRKLSRYDIKPNIYFEDKDGNEYMKEVQNISYTPNFNFKDIYNYLKSQGEL